jgi:hypothetical protein
LTKVTLKRRVVCVGTLQYRVLFANATNSRLGLRLAWDQARDRRDVEALLLDGGAWRGKQIKEKGCSTWMQIETRSGVGRWTSGRLVSALR